MEARKKRSTKLLAWLAAIAVVFAMTLPSSVVWADVEENNPASGDAGATEVVQIGETKYDSLQAAVNAIQGGSATTINLLSNIEQTAITIPENRTIIFDLNGYTLSLNSTQEITDTAYANGTNAYLLNSGNLTIRNGMLTGNDGSNLIVNRGTLTIDKSTTISKNGGNAIVNLGGTVDTAGSITVTASNGGAGIVTLGGTVTMNDGVISSQGDKRYSTAIDIFNRGYNNTSNGAKVTINGGKLTADSYVISTNNVRSGGNEPSNLTIVKGELQSNNGTAIYWPSAGTLTIGNENGNDSDINIEGHCAVQICSGTLILNSGKLQASGEDTYLTDQDLVNGFRNYSGSNSDGSALSVIARRGSGYNTAPLKVIINGGTLSSDKNAAIRYMDCNLATNAEQISQTVEVAISGGVFNGGTNVSETDVPDIDASFLTPSEEKFVSGGIYSSDVSQYVVPGNTAVKNEDGTYSIGVDTTVDSVAVAEVNGFGYTTLQGAVNAANDNETISLLKSVKESIDVPEGKTLTLDLNGQTLTNTDNKDTISNYGTLSIMDTAGNGVIDNITHGKGSLVNYVEGNVTISGGTLTRSAESGETNSWYTIKNLGTMKIEKNVVVTTGKDSTGASSLIANGWYDGGSTTGLENDRNVVHNANDIAKLAITGGTFSGGMNTVKNDDYSKLDISGGEFTNTTGPIVLNWNEASISGGTFIATNGAVLSNGYLNETSDKGQFSITGGTFTSGNQGESVLFSVGGGSKEGGKLSISGAVFNGIVNGNSKYEVVISSGEFSNKVDQKYIVTGKTAVSLTSGNDARYYIGDSEDIAETAKTAASGDTITILQGDLTLTNVPVGVTVENNGAGTVTVNGTAVAPGESVTVPKPTPPVVKADYTAVDAAIAKANALTADNYKDFSAVEAAIKAVVRDKNSSAQAEVDAMAKAIEDAIGALQYKDADYTAVDAALEKAAALNKEDYKDFSAVEAAIAAVVRDKNITQQAEVDAMAKAIEDAIAALEAAPKPEPEPAETVTKADIAAGTMALNKKIKATWSNSNLAVTWGKVSKADGYEVYAAKCGNSYTKVKTVKGSDTLKYTVKKINGKKLNTKTTYKVCVKAYRIIDGKKKYTGTSYGMHTVGLKNKTYTNAKSVKAAKKSITLKKGKTQKAAVTITKQTSKKKLLKSSHVANLRYFSTNTKVATVTKAGTIKAAGKGTCTVYALAANGVKTTVKVTVK